MAPEQRVSPEQVPARRIKVLVGTLPIEDGQTPPPVVGEIGTFPLIFAEARHDQPDATASTWRVRAEPGNDGKPRGPGRRWDGIPHDRPPYWPTTLHGDGWSANWPAPRPLTGRVELRGTLVGDMSISSQQWVRGRVIRAHVVTETIDTSDPDQTRWRPIPALQSLREVEVSPRWFADGLVAPPDAPTTGWYAPVPGDPYVVEAGVLVELDLDDVPPLPLRPAIVPTSISAYGDDLWVLDAALPLLVRLRGTDPDPDAPPPVVHRYRWPGRILTDGYATRRVHADATGCWITGPDGVHRAHLHDADRHNVDPHDGEVDEVGGVVEQVDERTVTTAHASAGTLLVAQLPPDAPPTTDSLKWRLYTPDRNPIEVAAPPNTHLQTAAPDGHDGFVLLLNHLDGDHAGPPHEAPARLAHLDARGSVTEAASSDELHHAQLVAGSPVLVSTSGRSAGRPALQIIDDDLTVRPLRVETATRAHYLLAAHGRVFGLGPVPDRGRWPYEMASPEAWCPLPGPVTHPDDRRYELLTELDPRTGEPIDTTLVGRPDHLAIDGNGTVWLPGHSTIYSCPPGHGSTQQPLDLDSFLARRGPGPAPRPDEPEEE